MGIVKAASKILLCAFLLYSAAYMVFSSIRYASVAHVDLPYIDTYFAKKDPCILHDAQAAILYKTRISDDIPKIIVLGGSSARDGFRPNEISALLPKYEVHNLAFSSANASQMLEVVKFLADTSNPDKFKDTIFLFGVFSGALISNEGRNWGQDNGPFQTQIQQFPEYFQTDQNVYSVKYNDLLSRLSVHFHSMPLMCVVSNLKGYDQDLRDRVKAILARVLRDASSGNERKKNKKSEQKKRRSILKSTSRSINVEAEPYSEQIAALKDISFVVEGMGAKLLLVEIPVAPWYRAQSLDSQKLEEMLQALRKQKDFEIISINYGFSDDVFRDHAHPKMRATHLWAEKLAAELKNTTLID